MSFWKKLFGSSANTPKKQGTSSQSGDGWYFTEREAKHVRQVVLNIPKGNEIKPRVATLLMADDLNLITIPWCAGFSKMGDVPYGPFLFVRADYAVEHLKGSPMRVAFAFFRMDAGGLFTIFVDVNCPEVAAKTRSKLVVFENAYGLDTPKTIELIDAAINTSHLELCFIGGDGPSTLPGGFFGVRVPLSDECRAILKAQLADLRSYHSSIPSGRRDFSRSVSQFQNENPQGVSPICPK